MADATAGLEVGLYISNAGAESGGHSFLDTPLPTIMGLIARNVLTLTAACHHFRPGHAGAQTRRRGAEWGPAPAWGVSPAWPPMLRARRMC